MSKIAQMEPWLGKEEAQAVRDYMESGGWLTEFKCTAEFENAIARYTGAKYAVAVSNGTVSLTCALLALGLQGGDEVVIPDFTMIASATATVLAGARPVLVDIDPSNLCLNLETIESVITSRTKAIMVVSVNGRSPDMDAIVRFAQGHNIFIVEDAAQSLGSRFHGKHLGTFGDIGSFSFSSPKVITTGQGGVLVTDEEDLRRKFLLIKNFGRTKSGQDSYEILGFNFKFTDLQAVIGIEQMKKLPWRVERKKQMYQVYRDLLADVPEVSFVETNLQDTSPWFIDALVENRDSLMSFLTARDIETRPFYPPIHTQPPFAHVKGSFPQAERVSKMGIWLPSSSFLTDDEIRRVCTEIMAFFRH
jgi:perosamine synthetase